MQFKQNILIGILVFIIVILGFSLLRNTNFQNFVASALSAIGISSTDRSSSGGTHFGCKDQNATNYEYFAASDPSLCIYENSLSDFKNSDGATTISGKLQVLHIDDFRNNRASYSYYVEYAPGKNIQISAPDIENLRLSSGDMVTAVGSFSGSILSTEASKIFSQNVSSTVNNHYKQPPPSTQNIIETKKVAVILFQFQNQPAGTMVAPGYDKAFVKKNVYDDVPNLSVQDYMQEVSHGKLSIAGALSTDGSQDIFGYYTIPYNETPCNKWNWQSASETLAQADGFVRSNYNVVVHVFPTNSCGAGVGISTIAAPHSTDTQDIWLTDSWLPGYLHELGHTFGLNHDNSFDCSVGASRVSVGSHCVSHEYGDPFGTMGGGASEGKHYNNRNLDYLGFSDISDVRDVTSSGTFTLHSAEDSLLGINTIRIPIATNGVDTKIKYYYFLEYRQPYSWDNFSASDPVVNGISIRIGSTNQVSHTNLIDATPSTVTYNDSALSVGNTFMDADRGISVKLLSVSGADAQVQVSISDSKKLSSCILRAPSISSPNASQSGALGQMLSYQINITNKDSTSCPGREFMMTSPSTFTGFTYSSSIPLKTPFYLNPGGTQTIQFDLTSPSQSTYTQSRVFGLSATDNSGLIEVPSYAGLGIVYKIIGDQLCGNEPLVSVTPASQIGRGQAITYQATLKNINDPSCAVSSLEYRVYILGKTGWSFVDQNYNSSFLDFMVGPGQTGTNVFTLFPPPGLSAGDYDFQINSIHDFNSGRNYSIFDFLKYKYPQYQPKTSGTKSNL